MEWGFSVAGTWVAGVDLIVLIFCILGGVSGGINSFSRILGKRAGALIGILFAFMFSRSLSVYVMQAFSLGTFVSVLVSYCVLFTVTYITVSVLGTVLGNILESVGLDPLDRLLGFVVGFLEAIIICVLVLHLLEIQRLIPLQDYIHPSIFYRRITEPMIVQLF
ncbi:CvpA family protein [Parasphaerochaeta coccoides]|uniref:Colicin V production protein n=1 Tax=Parasphaerochaeta coccoides (strain ATCC BAA-1237 / DSM 17374 / SPN1) TaxID=760011 RepID=F4GKV2_PARC1|nr:CvpA family protein [Parasphaerochaeta coccoides]AEC01865.1 Colicin V production protein [Parasphaerochaeta coccoides DSM 17374]